MTAIVADSSGHTHAWGVVTAKPVVGTREAYTIGDGLATVYNVTHGVGSADVLVQVYRISDGVDAILGGLISAVARTSTTNVRVTFLVPPASNSMRVVVVGA